MSASTLRWTRRATRRLDRTGNDVAKDNPDAAAQIVTRIVSAVDNLASHPSMGRVGRIKGTREYPVGDNPYITVYRPQAGVVEIFIVFHGAQKWPLQLDQYVKKKHCAEALCRPLRILLSLSAGIDA